ncbi:MAG TPA: S8 family serine peptidase [Phycisphaerae bacterium]|nr:S8 family serine peptidase [Phycisphaerae bacterium]
MTLVVVGAVAARADADIRWRNGAMPLARRQAGQIGPAIEELTRGVGARHMVVQFDQPITEEDRAKLEASGVQLLDPLSDNAFFAAVNGRPLDAAGLAAVPGFSRVAAVDPSWKLHPSLAMGDIPAWAIVTPEKKETDDQKESVSRAVEPVAADAMVAVYIKFHADVPLATEAVNVSRQYGANVKSQLPIVNTLVIELPSAMIAALAAEDIVEWIEPPLPALQEVNAENRALTGANTVQAPPYSLTGAGVNVLVYDGGRVRTTHVDFQGRAVIGSAEAPCSGLSDHSTHVAGTVAGGGVANANNKGMAPGANIISYGFQQSASGTTCPSLSAGFLYTDPGDLNHDYDAAINVDGAHISNNSIGTNTAPNGFPCSWEGDYGTTSALIDSIVRGSLGSPFRVIWANGNERGSGACGTTYHTTAPPACAKNHITVGALNANDDSLTSFTSWGPADDDRMKPDVSAPGCQVGGDGGVTSCLASSDTAYGSFCGTSMASPTVCGLSALIMQDYRAHFGMATPFMRNSTLKILLAHTAVDRGNVGPDNQFGYGSVRVQPAIDFMRSNNYGNFIENQVSQGGSYNTLVVVNPGDPVMKVTLAWDDVPGTPNVNPALVNDLDLVVFDPNNVQRFPWTLGGLANPSAPAVQTQANHVDNIEQVLVNAPTPGVYRVEVRGFNVPQGPQPFSVCASPLLVNCSRQGLITLDRVKYACSSSATIRVVDCDLNTNDNVVETVNVTIGSTTEPAGETVLLTETGAQTATFQGSISLSTTDSPGVLHIAHADMVTATYIDADDGLGGLNVVVTDTATVDCVPPIISNVQVSAIGPHTATVTFDTDELANGVVHYGTTCGTLTSSAAEGGDHTAHSVVISGIDENSTYFFSVEATDQAANAASDDNSGACYTFQTPDIPNFFTENFDGNDNDMDNRSVLFTPNGSFDFYAMCGAPIVALPTDPTGGTPITSWTGTADDGNALITLTGGNTVSIYGDTYGSFYVNTNGNVTFVSGDNDYTETLGDHFAARRVAAVWDDLNPGTGGTVSWKQLADRAVVTWQGVPEYSTTNSNTFQIELYFDGRIQIAYLAVAVADGLAGLSGGTGLSPDFFETDLSAAAACGPLPPSASNSSINTPVNTAADVTLVAGDPNLDPLTFIIVSLPIHGNLRDPGTGYTVIGSVPYTLVGGGDVVRYTPASGYNGPDSFTWKANDGMSDSNIATVSITVGGPQAIHVFNMDTNPGWTTSGQWAWGQPTGGGSHNFDPPSGFTGSNVYGYNLTGDYPNSLSPVQYLTTLAIDCSGVTQTELRFRRWLGIESATYDHANIEVSNNGSTWTTVWNHTGGALSESSWSLQTYNIAAVADGQPTVYIRWGMGTTDTSITYPGWNIDDVEIWALAPSCPAISVDPASLPNATAGGAYNEVVTASGGTGPYSFAVTTGSLPAGLTLSAGGVLSGTPSGPGGIANFTITATDANSCTGERAYALAVNCATITLSPTSLPATFVDRTYEKTLTAGGGSGPYSYAVTAGALPPGMTLSPSGVISGTSAVGGTYNFTVTATDSAGCPGSRAYSIAVRVRVVDPI